MFVVYNWRNTSVSPELLRCQCSLRRTALPPPNSTVSRLPCRPSGPHRRLARVFIRGRRWPTVTIRSRMRPTTRRWRHRWAEVGTWRRSAEWSLVMGRAAVFRCTVIRTAVPVCRRRRALWYRPVCCRRVPEWHLLPFIRVILWRCVNQKQHYSLTLVNL